MRGRGARDAQRAWSRRRARRRRRGTPTPIARQPCGTSRRRSCRGPENLRPGIFFSERGGGDRDGPRRRARARRRGRETDEDVGAIRLARLRASGAARSAGDEARAGTHVDRPSHASRATGISGITKGQHRATSARAVGRSQSSVSLPTLRFGSSSSPHSSHRVLSHSAYDNPPPSILSGRITTRPPSARSTSAASVPSFPRKTRPRSSRSHTGHAPFASAGAPGGGVALALTTRTSGGISP